MKHSYFLIDMTGNIIDSTQNGEEAFDWVFHQTWGAIFVIPKRLTDAERPKCYTQPGFNIGPGVILDKCFDAL